MNSLEFFVDLPRFDSARCAEIADKNLFFPNSRKQEAERLPQLQAICASCIHSKECLEYALEKQMSYGIWGGATPADREAVAVKNGKTNEFQGMSLVIVQLTKKGMSANEIAGQLNTSLSYVRRVLHKLTATEQGAEPLHRQIKDSSEGLQ